MRGREVEVLAATASGRRRAVREIIVGASDQVVARAGRRERGEGEERERKSEIKTSLSVNSKLRS